jgi:hypothetical protein
VQLPREGERGHDAAFVAEVLRADEYNRRGRRGSQRAEDGELQSGSLPDRMNRLGLRSIRFPLPRPLRSSVSSAVTLVALSYLTFAAGGQRVYDSDSSVRTGRLDTNHSASSELSPDLLSLPIKTKSVASRDLLGRRAEGGRCRVLCEHLPSGRIPFRAYFSVVRKMLAEHPTSLCRWKNATAEDAEVRRGGRGS